MLMTEKQAAQTWCPHSSPDSKGFCLAHGCAAWRWKQDPEAKTPMHFYRSTGEQWVCEHCKGPGCAECEGEGKGTLKAPVGFCGLAGPVELLG